jgi:hypothetical protein
MAAKALGGSAPTLAKLGGMRGALVCNGNLERDADFAQRCRPDLLSSRHQDPELAERLPVLLVTAGWRQDEYRETHLKKALYAIGLQPRLERGHDTTVRNLSLFHNYQEFWRQRPSWQAAWEEREALIESARTLYLEKNSFFIASLRSSLSRLRSYRGHLSLLEVLEGRLHSGSGLAKVLNYLSADIRATLSSLQSNDDHMVALLAELEDEFAHGLGLAFDPLWQDMRQEMSQRILDSNSLFMMGGHLPSLHRCLSFFQLRPALHEALRRGTTFYTSSAGSLLCCERIIIYNDFEDEREFQLYDRGLALIGQLQIFPHCMDRIQTDDVDNLTYLAQRFRHRVCVGLNSESFLRLELGSQPRATSCGAHDAVYVFDRSGQKMAYHQGQTLAL